MSLPRLPIEEKLRSALAVRAESGALRTLQLTQGVDLCSNDYLGLSRSEKLSQKTAEIFSNVSGPSNGSTGSRLISGNSAEAEQLENSIARYHTGEAALLFSSGYAANLGLFSAVLSRHDTVLYDEYVHASIRDGIRISFSKAFSFRHNSIEDLEQRLMRVQGSALVVVESLYSMDGDGAPLSEVARICADHGAALIVDEAHAVGIYGTRGEGIIPALDLSNSTFARIYTFGKALGVHGAVVVGSATLREYLINFARSFIFTTAVPPHAIAAIRAAYEVLPDLNEERRRLWDNIALFDKSAIDSGFSNRLVAQKSPIKSLLIPGNREVQAAALAMNGKGYDVRAIRSPAVPAGKERLRVCIHAHNTREEILGFVEGFRDYLEGGQ
jgi:8-amino-7-oxononanoate synthase